jgi:hypothetical protein
MFTKPIALNRDTHRQLRFRPIGGFSFASGLHSAPLCASEFYAAAKEYAILFVRLADGGAVPVVALGLKQQENLFVSREGQWNARYLPASMQAYPFAFIENADGDNLQILIDQAYPGFGETQGTALFDDAGDPSPELQQKLKFLQAHHSDRGRTRRLGAELVRLGLLTECSAQLQGDARFQLHGFWIVDEAKLAALDDAALLPLARQGHLSLITAHLLSISNLGLLPSKLKQTS